jgi:hypothetical protein
MDAVEHVPDETTTYASVVDKVLEAAPHLRLVLLALDDRERILAQDNGVGITDPGNSVLDPLQERCLVFDDHGRRAGSLRLEVGRRSCLPRVASRGTENVSGA